MDPLGSCQRLMPEFPLAFRGQRGCSELEWFLLVLAVC